MNTECAEQLTKNELIMTLFLIQDKKLKKPSLTFWNASSHPWLEKPALERRDCDQNVCGLKPFRAILLCSWESTWQAPQNFGHVFHKVNRKLGFYSQNHD